MYVTSSHIRTCCTRVRLHVLKEEFREVRETHLLVSLCRMCQVTVLRWKWQRSLRKSCCRPVQFRSSCHHATTIETVAVDLCSSEALAIPVFCVRSVILRKYLNPFQNYMHAALHDVRSRNIPTVRAAYVSPWHLSCLFPTLIKTSADFLIFVLCCLCSVWVTSYHYYPQFSLLSTCLSLSRLNQIIFNLVLCFCILALFLPVIYSSIYTQSLPVFTPMLVINIYYILVINSYYILVINSYYILVINSYYILVINSCYILVINSYYILVINSYYILAINNYYIMVINSYYILVINTYYILVINSYYILVIKSYYVLVINSYYILVINSYYILVINSYYILAINSYYILVINSYYILVINSYYILVINSCYVFVINSYFIFAINAIIFCW